MIKEKISLISKYNKSKIKIKMNPRVRRQSKNNKKSLTFEELIFYPDELLNVLLSSYELQKKFIELVIGSLKGNSEEISSIKYISQLFIILPEMVENIGLSLVDLLLNEEELIQLLIEIFLEYDKYRDLIQILFKKINETFLPLEDDLIYYPMEPYLDILFNLDILDETDIQNPGYNYQNITNYEKLYINLSNLFRNWIKCRSMGDDIEEESLQHLDLDLKDNEYWFSQIEKNDNLPNSALEFLKELILKIKQFRSEKFQNNKKYQINNTPIEMSKSEIQKLKNIPLIKRTYFYKNEKINEDENEYIEYKNYFFPFGENQINELKRQFCGFMNSKGGRLFIGINDLKIIKGVVINEQGGDALNNVLFNCIHAIHPNSKNGNEDKIKIFYIPIKNKNNLWIKDLYVVKVIILPGDPSILYSMSENMFTSVIRLQGQCANLTAEEIHMQIIERHKNKNNINNYNEKDFDDPQPEIIEYNDDDEAEEENIYDNYFDSQEVPKSNRGIVLCNTNRQKKRRQEKNLRESKSRSIPVRVYNIDKSIPKKDLYKIFRGCGCCSSMFCFTRRGDSRGFGFLYFLDNGLADRCISSFNGKILENKKLKLKKEVRKNK